MELIGFAGIAICGLLGATISRVFSDEIRAWLPWLTERIIQRAVCRLPADDKNRYDEEWRSHINEIPGDLGKIITAFGFIVATRKMRVRKSRFRIYKSRIILYSRLGGIFWFAAIAGAGLTNFLVKQTVTTMVLELAQVQALTAVEQQKIEILRRRLQEQNAVK